MLHVLFTQAPQEAVPQAVQQAVLQAAEPAITLDLQVEAVRIAMAVAVGVVLALVYRSTHKGLSYSQTFTQTIVFVAVIVAIVMMTVRNSIATAFTLVGALSIIRFRTVVKDTRDAAFIFAALALGMAAGLGFWELAALGVGVVAALACVLHTTNFGSLQKSEFVLRLTFDQDRDSTAYLAQVGAAAKRSSLLHVEPIGDGHSLRLCYDISLKPGATAESLVGALSRADGVSEVALLVSKNEVDY